MNRKCRCGNNTKHRCSNCNRPICGKCRSRHKKIGLESIWDIIEGLVSNYLLPAGLCEECPFWVLFGRYINGTLGLVNFLNQLVG